MKIKTMASNNSIVLSVEIRPNVLRAALFDVKKTPAVMACESCPFGENFDEAAESLRSLVKIAGKRLRHTVLVLGREEVLLKKLEFPLARPRDLHREVQAQLAQQLPYAAAEVASDYTVLDTAGGQARVLLVVAHKRVVEDKLEKLALAGLKPDFIVYSSEGIFAACREKNFRWAGPAATLFIDVDERGTEVVYADQTRLEFSRKVDIHAEDLETDDPAVLSKLVQEIEILVKGRAGDVRELVKRVVISGPALKGGFLALKMREYFGADAELLKIEGQESVTFSLTPLYGGAQVSMGRPVNLLPDEAKKTRRKGALGRELNQILYACSGVALAVLVVMLSHLGTKGYVLHKIEQEMKYYRPRIVSLKPTVEGFRIKSRYEKGKWQILETLAALHEIAPAGVTFRSLDFSPKKGFAIRGMAETNQQVTDFSGLLRDYSSLRNVALEYSRAKKGKDGERFDFELKFGVA